MKSQIASASKIIHAPADVIYSIIADFRNQHPYILPQQYFQDLQVEEGGVGAGTITSFQMRLLGKAQHFRTRITEPQPGRVLIETDIRSGAITTFDLSPLANESGTRVTISTGLKDRGAVEGFIGKLMLPEVDRAELELLTERSEKQAALL